MRKNNMSHRQRKNACVRKTWTKAERFQKRLKNDARLADLRKSFAIGNPMIEKLLDDAAKELAHEHNHEHGEECAHEEPEAAPAFDAGKGWGSEESKP